MFSRDEEDGDDNNAVNDNVVSDSKTLTLLIFNILQKRPSR